MAKHGVPFVLLASAFVISIMLRYDTLHRPLAGDHEFITAHTLITLSIWEESSAYTYNFNPVYTFPAPENKHINNLGGIKDEYGNYYYVSYPQFGFIFPYFVSKTFGFKITEYSIKYINLGLHFFCSILIYLFLLIFWKKKENVAIFGVMSALVYMFFPTTMWYQSNVYFVDMLAQVLFLLSATVWMYCFSLNKWNSFFLKIFYGLSVFLLAYTEWIAAFYLLCSCLALFLLRKKITGSAQWILISCLSGVAAVGLSVFQYAQISGLDVFLDALVNKYHMRSGFAESEVSDLGLNAGNALTFTNVFYHYFLNYQYIIWVILAGSVFLFIKRESFLKITGNLWIPILLLGGPVLLHHIVFLNFTSIHEFAVLKSAIIIAIVFGIICFELSSLFNLKQVIFIAILTVLFLSIKHIRIFQHRYQRDDNRFKILAEQFKPIIKNYVVFCDQKLYNQPQFYYYLHRNVFCVDPKVNVNNFIQKHLRLSRNEMGIFIQVSKEGVILKYHEEKNPFLKLM